MLGFGKSRWSELKADSKCFNFIVALLLLFVNGDVVNNDEVEVEVEWIGWLDRKAVRKKIG